MLYIATISTFLLFATVLVPVYASQRRHERRLLLHAYRRFQLDMLRAYYPALREMTDKEIRQGYDVDRIFASIGERR